MKRPFENFAAWRLATASAPARVHGQHDDNAWQRWDGEGGNPGMPAARRKLVRANALARARRAANLKILETAWKRIASHRAASAKG